MQREFTVSEMCDEIVPTIQRALSAAGFRVEQSFDLRSALALVPNCTCPHHGTAQCDCQYNVLLIHGQALTPVSLVVHGHDHQCWIALADDPNGRETLALMDRILQALTDARLISTDKTDDVALQAAASRDKG